MNPAIVSNIVTALLCLAVLVQSARLMRGLKLVRRADLSESIRQLDGATGAARNVLADLKTLLETEGRANSRTVDEAQKMREELGMMIRLADSMAERLVEAASRRVEAEAPPAPEPAAPPAPEPAAPVAAKAAPSAPPARRPETMRSFVLPVRRPATAHRAARGAGPLATPETDKGLPEGEKTMGQWAAAFHQTLTEAKAKARGLAAPPAIDSMDKAEGMPS